MAFAPSIETDPIVLLSTSRKLVVLAAAQRPAEPAHDNRAFVWFVFTPGRSILAPPLKLTPPIVLAFANRVDCADNVAVAEFPVHDALLPDVLADTALVESIVEFLRFEYCKIPREPLVPSIIELPSVNVVFFS